MVDIPVMELSKIPSWLELYEQLEQRFENEEEFVLLQLLKNINIDFNKKYYKEVLLQLEDLLVSDIGASAWSEETGTPKSPYRNNSRIHLLVRLTCNLEKNVNALSLSNIVLLVCKEETLSGNVLQSLSLLAYFIKYCSESDEAVLHLQCEKVNLLLQTSEDGVLAYVEETVKPLHEKIEIMEPYVNAKYFKTLSKVYLSNKMYRMTYESIRTYMCYVDLNELDEVEKIDAVKILCISTLLSEGVFSFSEVLEQPIMRWYYLVDHTSSAFDPELATEMHILRSIEKATDAATLQTSLEKSPNLQQYEEKLLEKLCLSRLLDFCFNSQQGNRKLKISEIQQICGMSGEMSTFRLLVKAMAHDLLGGSINGVEGVFTLDWTRSSAMNAQKSSSLASCYDHLLTKTAGLHTFYEKIHIK